MKTLALAALTSLASLVGAGCGARACKQGTVLLSVTLDGPARAATNIEVDVQTDAGDHRSSVFGWSLTGAGTVEIDFPTGYPEGHMVTVRVNALKGAGKIATARTVFSAEAGCTAVALDVGAEDGGVACDPGVDDRCSDDRKSLLSCRADGSGFDTTACVSGCGDVGAQPHCQTLDPSGAIDPALDKTGTQKVVLAADATFNTDTGEISGALVRPAGAGVMGGIGFRSVPQPGSTVTIGAFSVAGLTIMQGATVHVAGRSPLAIVSTADVSVAGAIDLQGDCMSPDTVVAGQGAGGKPGVNNGDGLGTRPGRSGSGAADAASGGGGAGAADAGGRGGNGAGTGGGPGGIAFGDLTVEPLLLVGGPGGGAGGGPAGGVGGHGGGALQLAVDGALTVSGTVHAGACGGKPGGGQSAGGGGGSGGAILLEATTLMLTPTAILAANGGGGGGGDGGSAGGDGAPNTAFGAAGRGASNGAGGGSGGATGRTRGQNGGDAVNTLKNGGGGGGACGRIAFKTLSGAITDKGATLSPSPADRNTANQPVTTTTVAHFQ